MVAHINYVTPIFFKNYVRKIGMKPTTTNKAALNDIIQCDFYFVATLNTFSNTNIRSEISSTFS